MPFPYFRSLIFALAILCSSSAYAQTAKDPLGHWEGSITAPNHEMRIEVDLARTSAGELVATFGNPADHLAGLPLADVRAQGVSVHFALKAGAGGGVFEGMLSADGASISGTFTTGPDEGSVSVPFSLKKTGEARIAPPARSAAIANELEGAWSGTIEVEGKSIPVGLHLANHPDGTSSGTVAALGHGSLEIPITSIVQNASKVDLDVKIVNGSYSGTLNAAGNEMSGTWTQGSFSAPLVFRKSATTKDHDEVVPFVAFVSLVVIDEAKLSGTGDAAHWR